MGKNTKEGGLLATITKLTARRVRLENEISKCYIEMRIQRRALETYYRDKEKKDKKMKRKKEVERLKRASMQRRKNAKQKKADGVSGSFVGYVEQKVKTFIV